MARLSIVIPCPQNAAHFESTLVSVLQHRPDDCEVLVVQPSPYEDPYDLATEVRFIEGSPDCTLVDLINLGFQHAVATVVHLLTCDVEVKEDWTEAVLPHFQRPSVGSVSPRVVDVGDTDRLIAAGVHYGSGGCRRVRQSHDGRWFRDSTVLGPTLRAGFYRRDAVIQAGGFCAGVGETFADVDIALRLRALGYEATSESDSIVAMTSRPIRTEPLFQSGRCAERLFWRHAASVGWTRSLIGHGVVVLGETAVSAFRPITWARLMGRIAGGFEAMFSSHSPCPIQAPPPATDRDHVDSAEPTEKASAATTNLSRRSAA